VRERNGKGGFSNHKPQGKQEAALDMHRHRLPKTDGKSDKRRQSMTTYQAQTIKAGAKPNYQLYCALCKKPLLDNKGEGHFAEIRRGYFHESELHEGDNDCIFCDSIKFAEEICMDCYLNDPDFCRFMNKIGCRIR
jgi:hypothetical protein